MQSVREVVNFGACRILGEFVSETETAFMYRKPDTGRATRIAKKRKPRFAGECQPRPHVEPCGNCPERRDPRACIHGRVGFCETCMST